MTFGRGAALALGLAGGLALGIWTGPYITDTVAMNLPGESAVTTPARGARVNASEASARRPATSARTLGVISVSEPALHDQLKPLLNSGTNMTGAASGFKSPEQFAMVAHAAHNTQIPFQVLKDRVVRKGQSLESVIREFNPNLNATIEANRARAEATSDIARLRMTAASTQPGN